MCGPSEPSEIVRDEDRDWKKECIDEIKLYNYVYKEREKLRDENKQLKIENENLKKEIEKLKKLNLTDNSIFF